MIKTIQPRKQRKKIYQDPLHKRYKRFSSPLSSELKATHNTGSVQVRTGDTVRVYRGEHKGLEGKVTKVDTKNYRIFVEGVTREKIDGTPAPIPMHPSKTMITRLNLDDRWRREALKRKSADKEEEKRKKEKQKTIE
ncbi:50S ribosomal protein L24 [Candidatus Bathyarchaeota archaeon]|nr:50S ribosomal protein L24 [Candidatus Bathyarchaeota archaeon]